MGVVSRTHLPGNAVRIELPGYCSSKNLNVIGKEQGYQDKSPSVIRAGKKMRHLQS